MMNPKKILFVKSCLPYDDPRVLKEINTLKKHNFEISLICWDETNNSCNSIDFPHEVTIYKGKYFIGSLKLIFTLPVWWIFVFLELMKKKWDIVHVINIHSVFPVIIAGLIQKKPVIYEIEDVFEDTNHLPKLIRPFIKVIDKVCMKFASAVIVIDEKIPNEFNGIPNKNVISIYDSPVDCYSHNKPLNSITDSEKEKFLIFNEGLFYGKRNLMLESLFSAVCKSDNVMLVLSGKGDQIDFITEWEQKYPEKIKYLGYIDYDEVIRLSFKCDLLLGLRNPEDILNKYNCGSKLMKAMMCGKPCLVNKETSGADIVLKENCGLIIDGMNQKEIMSAIETLRNDPQMVKILGENARIAYEKKYGWEIMEGKLLELYKKL